MAPTISFTKKVKAKKNKTILDVAKKNKIKIYAPCEKGSCGKCIVKVVGGKLSKPDKKEIKHLGKDRIEQGYRLACLAEVKEDCQIEIDDKN